MRNEASTSSDSGRTMVLPTGWKAVKLSEVYSVTKKPRTLSIPNSAEVPFLPMELVPVHRKDITRYEMRYVSKGNVGVYFEEGDLVLARITPCFENGKQGIARNVPGGWGLASTEIIPLKAEPGQSEIGFLAYFLLDSEIRGRLAGRMEGATGRQRLRREALENLQIPFPPLREQRAIASVLSKIQRAVELEEKRISALKELKAATMAKVFREGLRGERLRKTEIGEIPESWEIKRFDEVAKIERGKFSHRPRNDPKFYGGNTPFIQTGDVVRGCGHVRTHTQTLNELGLSVSRVFPRGTIVLTIAANIADTGILEFDSAFPDSLVGVTPGKGMLAEFLEFFLRTQKTAMDRLAPKGTQKNINIQFLRPWPVLVPPLGEQQEIIRLLAGIDQRLENAVRRRAISELHFQSSLHQVMTGQLRVTALMDETPS